MAFVDQLSATLDETAFSLYRLGHINAKYYLRERQISAD